MEASEFKLRFPEFATTPDSLIYLHLADATQVLPPAVWGVHVHRAQGLLAAHNLAMFQRAATGATGPVTSESVGDISRSYAQASATGVDSAYASTVYGLEFSRLKKMIFVSPVIL